LKEGFMIIFGINDKDFCKYLDKDKVMAGPVKIEIVETDKFNKDDIDLKCTCFNFSTKNKIKVLMNIEIFDGD